MRNSRVNTKRRVNRRLKDPFAVRVRRFFSRYGKIALVASAVPLVGLGGWWTYGQVLKTEYLAINTIEVNGAERISRDDVMALSGISEGQNILSFSKKDVVKRIAENPWVEEAVVSRSLPGTVEIAIKERKPVALVKMDALYVMDFNGVVFKKAVNDDGLDLPVVTGLTKELIAGDTKGIQQKLLELITALKGRKGFNLASVSEIKVDPAFGLSILTINDGVRLEVGFDGFEEKLLTFEKVLRARGGVLAGIEAMDLNNKNEVVVRFTTDVVREGGGVNGKKG